ncbi:hypothetical protein Pmani_026141 [Petrolisthes manimaculis]|uniref:Ig-like domain-containing protein n=1 Tax=Petrolisthes manimaculis TaxID=1843537 RepID=A0AAE1U0E1_9EUCA|nr:hypothetical protein Pmani_026141 [Petrolisthes manimaculis]
MDIVCGLRITRVNVPTPVVVNESVWLECDFVEEQENVYALKWYLGLDEFFRWTPAESPSVKTFPVKGNPLMVDTAASQRGRVRIHDVKLGATGVFRCEVSAEAPSFHTESAVATMTVLDLPDEKPRITGVRAAYQMHEDVRLNCSSPHSQPPATLAFYVNDEPADPAWVIEYTPLEDHETGLETAVLGLRFPLRPRLLQRGPAVVKCTAAIEDRYWESSVMSVHSDIPHQASIMEGRASASRGCVVLASRFFTVGLVAWQLLHLFN